MNDTLKELQDVCKKVILEIRNQDIKIVDINGTMTSLELKKEKMLKEFEEIQAKMDKAVTDVRLERKGEIDRIEQKLAEVLEKEKTLDTETAKAQRLQNELDSQRGLMVQETEKFQRGQTEFLQKKQEYEDKIKRFDEAMLVLKK